MLLEHISHNLFLSKVIYSNILSSLIGWDESGDSLQPIKMLNMIEQSHFLLKYNWLLTKNNKIAKNSIFPLTFMK